MDQGQGNISLRGSGWRSLDGGACIPGVGIAGAPGREVELRFPEQLLASGQGAGGVEGRPRLGSENQSIQGADKLAGYVRESLPGCTQAWRGARKQRQPSWPQEKRQLSREASRGR